MLITVTVRVDDDLLQAAIHKHHLDSRSEAVHLALRNLVGEGESGYPGEEDLYDEFSDPAAWVRRPPTDAKT
jgi:Arc/MetJ family transcription regulator